MATPDHRPVRLCWGPMGERPNTVRHAACLGWSMPVGARFSRPGWFSAFVARFACATFAQWVVGFRCSVAERTTQRPSKTENPQPKTSCPAQWPREGRGCRGKQISCRTVLGAASDPLLCGRTPWSTCRCRRVGDSVGSLTQRQSERQQGEGWWSGFPHCAMLLGSSPIELGTSAGEFCDGSRHTLGPQGVTVEPHASDAACVARVRSIGWVMPALAT